MLAGVEGDRFPVPAREPIAVGSRRRVAWDGLVLLVAATVPYGNALSGGFTFDDEFQILNNPAATGKLDAWTILSATLPGNLYRPFTTFTFALNHEVSPDSAFTYHAVNISLHALVTFLVAWLAQRLFRDRAVTLLAALVFAVHPVHTEAVSSLVGRAEELAALFGLVSLLFALRADASSTVLWRRLWWGFSLLSFLVALASKESALTVLPLLVMVRVVLRGDSWRHGLLGELRRLDWVPFVLCAAAYLVLRHLVVENAPTSPLDNPLVTVGPSVRIASALGVLWDYAAQLLVPLVLSADYSHPQVPVVSSWLDPRCLGGATLVAAAAATAALARPAVGFVALFPFVTLALTSNLLFPIGTIRADRLLYLPSVGWAVLAALLSCTAARRLRRPAVLYLVAGLWLSALAARTWIRNDDWRDDFTLHRETVRDAPFSAKAHLNYGVALQRAGRHEAALAQFREALALFPEEESAANGIGRELELTGRADEAAAWYQTALRIDPHYLPAYGNLCRLHLAKRRYAEAERACRSGLRLEPTDPNLLKGLGISLLESGARDQGDAVLRWAAAWNSRDPELQRWLASNPGGEDGAGRKQ